MTQTESSRSVPTVGALGLTWGRKITNSADKERIAERVASLAKEGEVIGAGSGSTSFLTVLALGRRAQGGLRVTVVPTSIEIELACRAANLLVDSNPTEIDWCFDGADEVDPEGRLIKGRGGALHKERRVFTMARKRVVVADNSKTVDRLGSVFPVPIEVEPDMIRYAYSRLHRLDRVQSAVLRMATAKDGPVITENGNVLVDVRFRTIAATDENNLLAIPGVCCTGIFSGFNFDRLMD